MGEAKRRKAADPNYGLAKRGLIITNPVEANQDGGGRVSGGLDLQDLRYALLFWDRLVWPSNNLIFIKSGPDAEYLEGAGILQRPRYNFSESKGIEPLVDAQVKAFNERDAAEPGVWDLCQTSAALLANSNQLIKDGGAQIELYQAIPVPDKDVPLNEILEFKQKRHTELVSLRNEIDGLMRGIDAAEDPRDELRKRLEGVDRACADAVRISSEWKFPVRLSNIKAGLDLRPFGSLAAGVGTYLTTTKVLGLTEAALAGAIGVAGAAASALKITGDFGWDGLKPRSSPYRYVAQFNRELF